MAALSPIFLKALNDDHGIKSFTVLSQRGNLIEGQGTRLVQLNRPDLGSLSGVFVEIPVDVSLETDDHKTLEKVRIQPVSDEDIEEAVSHVKRLVRHDQINPRIQAGSHATHTVETDSAGHKVLVRQRFS